MRESVMFFNVIRGLHWMAGMLYLPRLYVYHFRAKPGSEMDATFQEMERKLLRIIINPAMVMVVLQFRRSARCSRESLIPGVMQMIMFVFFFIVKIA